MNSHGCSTTVYQLPRASSLVWGPWGAAVVRALITFLYVPRSPNPLRSTTVCKDFQEDYWKAALFPAPVLPGPFLIPPGPMWSGVREVQSGLGSAVWENVFFFPGGLQAFPFTRKRKSKTFIHLHPPNIQKQNEIIRKPRY